MFLSLLIQFIHVEIGKFRRLLVSGFDFFQLQQHWAIGCLDIAGLNIAKVLLFPFFTFPSHERWLFFFLFALLRLNTLFSHLCAELTKDLETNRSKNWNIALLLEKKWFFLFCCWWNSCIFYLEKKGTVNWAVRAWNKQHWTLVHLSYVNSEKRRNSSKSSACRLESRNGHLNWSW